MTIFKILWICFGLAFLSINTVYGDTLNVPADYLTIQAAVDEANDGDTILVGPGTYHENVVIGNNHLTLKGAGINNSILEWDGGDACIRTTFDLEIDFFIVIEGFTINNLHGEGIWLSSNGNGINAEIRNCEITGYWTGIRFRGNTGTSYIENNIISASSPIIKTASAIEVRGGTYYIQNNTIVNSSNGILAIFELNDEIRYGSITLLNNIIASNMYYGFYKVHGYQTFIQYNNVWNNADGDYAMWNPSVSGIELYSPDPGDGEISENPDFVGGEDFHLSCFSPCIDVGICTDVVTDIDTDERPFGTGCDMGADEFYGQVCPEWTRIDLYLIPKWRPNINSLISSRRLPISILTTDVFDAVNADPLSIELSGAYVVRWKMKDVDKDGDKDMKIFFKTRDLDLNEDVTEITLEGETYDGIQFFGTLPVNVNPKGNAYGKTKR